MQKKKNEGFTLVELIVVMSIIAVIAGVSVGSYFLITNKAKKTAALAEANQIRTQVYTAVTQSGGYKSGKISEHGVSFPDNIEYFKVNFVAAGGEKGRVKYAVATEPGLNFTFYSDAYQTVINSYVEDYVRLGIGYLVAASSGKIDTASINKYANEVYVSTDDGFISSFDVIKDNVWVKSGITTQAVSLTGSTPVLTAVHIAPSVATGADISNSVWTNWYANDRYTRFEAKKAAVSDVKDGTTKSFMKATGYRVGNKNAVDLGPHVEAMVNGSPVSLNNISEGATHETITYKLYKGNDKSTDVKTTYVDETTYHPATDGKILFNTDAAGNDFTLVFTYGDGKSSSFPDVSYSLSVIDGLNVNTVSDLFDLNNCVTWTGDDANFASDTERSKRFASIKTKYSSVTGNNYNGAVFQSDITITLADIPDYFIWQTDEKTVLGTTIDTSLVGSLKDESYLVLHTHTKNSTAFDVYGNYFKISLGADFPKIASGAINSSSVPTGAVPGTNEVVESHAAVFSDKIDQYLNDSNIKVTAEDVAKFKTNFHDLAATGNHAVSDVADTKHAGVSFYKAFSGSSIEDCNLNGFYIPAMNNGRFVTSTSGSITSAKGITPTMTIDSSRLTDSGNVALFLYQEGYINVTSSEIRKAGGPLAIAYSYRYSSDDKTKAATTVANGSADPRLGSWITIDDKTVMENWVTGQGGWFKIHDVESKFASMAGFDALFQGQLSKTIVKTEGTNKNINVLAVTMGDGADTDGGFLGGVIVNNKHVIDYESGRKDLETNLASNNVSGAQTNLCSTDYGTLYLTNNASSTPVFKTIDSSGTSHFAGLYNNSGNLSLVNPKLYLTNSASDGALDSSFGSSDYLSLYYFGAEPKNGKLTANFSTYSSYAGADAYGILMTLSDK
jgi:prepilin-type N-terminal cleavage/methylation domain-containing protein